ncbi:uncharacterized protein BCR38DRAFT_338987 [Pseudomassariella vexata]|uniref:BAH domain-containing protein n=1 Tax=Pseudomassariella vexata TaxID=1141098 RepID=A0A1Y2E414_9PEZI|nr:uncharacterized protein BCR38DRAFT_338987 [Pseudomassariella vexata]ORY66187.1 hypothetical protein BCR38DRAFT_338987 [Pseudomassariella vexata]
MATAKKRPRGDAEESQAECPFKVEHPSPGEKEKKQKKRRRQDSEDQPQPSPKMPLQVSPFSPTGKFKDPNNTMDRHYMVAPNPRWTDMTRYNSFVLNGVKYYSEGFIFVANNSTIERQRNPGEAMQPRKKSDDDWVARILEIRASDEHHVYARVYWMYWPDELPPGTQDGRRMVQGRQPYHGVNELIASNHMDIINVVSVTAAATVNQWDEQNEDEIQSALYWRQAIDVRTMELSSVELRCKCNRPENPDKILVGCTNDYCKKWLHDDCLVHGALLDTYKRLGADKPHKPSVVKEEEGDGPKRPLSPSESGAGQTTQQSIDVKPEEQGTIKLADVENNPTALDVEDLTTIPVASGSSEPKKRGRPRKSEPGDPGTSKPYEGLFEAVIRNDLVPPVVEIKDQRQNVDGGDKSWTEPIRCLICHHVIH